MESVDLLSDPLIETPEALDALVAEARANAPADGPIRLALDTEADSSHSYREKLCLIQFGAAERYAVIDPLRIDDLEPLHGLMDECEIWFHGSDYDLMLWRRTFTLLPHFVYDTQIAAQLVGSTRFGLAALLEEHFGVVLAKESQRADWGKRPLADELIEYAINDVRYLIPLADILLARLDELGRRDWFLQSCEANMKSAEDRVEKDPDDLWRIKGWGTLKPRGWAYLRELWRWRDEIAAAADRPAFKVVPNGKLLYLAERLQSGREFDLHGKYSQAQKNSFREAARRARGLKDNELPKRKRGPGRPRIPDLPQRVKPLQVFRDKVAKELGLEPSLIAPRLTMEDIIIDPQTAEAILLPWQFALLRDGIARL